MAWVNAMSAASPVHQAFKWLVAAQIGVCLVIAFGDIGFDKPGRFGLHFSHFIALLALQLVFAMCAMLLPAGDELAAKRRRRVQYVLLLMTVFSIFVGD